MNTESTEDLYIANISKKETYSPEEKKFILKRLNDERLRQQDSKEASSNITEQYSQESAIAIGAKIPKTDTRPLGPRAVRKMQEDFSTAIQSQ